MAQETPAELLQHQPCCELEKEPEHGEKVNDTPNVLQLSVKTQIWQRSEEKCKRWSQAVRQGLTDHQGGGKTQIQGGKGRKEKGKRDKNGQ